MLSSLILARLIETSSMLYFRVLPLKSRLLVLSDNLIHVSAEMSGLLTLLDRPVLRSDYSND